MSAAEAAMAEVQATREVTKARRALTMFRSRDTGWAEARILAHSMCYGMCAAMVRRWDGNVPLTGPWLDDVLHREEFQRITMLDLFETWARLTARRADEARGHAAVAALDDWFVAWRAGGCGEFSLLEVVKLHGRCLSLGAGLPTLEALVNARETGVRLTF